MSRLPDSIRRTIECSFFAVDKSAAAIARGISTPARPVTSTTVYRVWDRAKLRGDLPNLQRPMSPGAGRRASR